MSVNDFVKLRAGYGYFYNKEAYDAPLSIEIKLDKNDYDFETKRTYPQQKDNFLFKSDGDFADTNGVEDGLLTIWRNGRGSTGSKYTVKDPDGFEWDFVVPSYEEEPKDEYTLVELRAASNPPVTPEETFNQRVDARVGGSAVLFNADQNLTDEEKAKARINMGALADDGENSGVTELEELSDVDLTAPANDDFLQRKAGLFVNRSIAQVKTDLGINFTVENQSNKNQNNGYAGLDGSGKVAAAQLPSFVDDVLEYANVAAFPVAGETSKIYVPLDTNKTYRWSGSAYVEISASPGSTDAVTEGVTNLYFTAARVLAVLLTGISFATNSAITATDSVLTAFGKLQAQITALISAVNSKADALGSDDNYVTDAEKTKLSNLSGINTGDQTTIAGITGTTAQFNTALTDNDFATQAGTETLTNKTISGASNTLTNIAQSAVTNLTADLASKAPALGADDNYVTDAEKTKIAGIEAGADVTDAQNVGAAIDSASGKTTPVDADTMPLTDSAASNVLKKVTWANIKATLKTYFDTLYQAVLVSGTNIKTINGSSLLGSGDLSISGEGGGATSPLTLTPNNATETALTIGSAVGQSVPVFNAANQLRVDAGATYIGYGGGSRVSFNDGYGAIEIGQANGLFQYTHHTTKLMTAGILDIGGHRGVTRLSRHGQYIWEPSGGTISSTPFTPATLTADVNNYDLDASVNKTSMFWRLSSDASRTITGINATISGVTHGETVFSGEVHHIINVGANNIVLAHENAASTAVNRMICSTSADITLAPNEMAFMFYDNVNARWRVYKVESSVGAGSEANKWIVLSQADYDAIGTPDTETLYFTF